MTTQHLNCALHQKPIQHVALVNGQPACLTCVAEAARAARGKRGGHVNMARLFPRSVSRAAAMWRAALCRASRADSVSVVNVLRASAEYWKAQAHAWADWERRMCI